MCRNFYRCVDCLAVSAVDGEIPRTYEPRRGVYQYAECGACSGQLEHMGKVSGQHLTTRHLCCPCDARCTNALGPNCDCQCGGENHGTRLLVPVEKVVGGLPRVTPTSYLASREVAREWREALAPILERLREVSGTGEGYELAFLVRHARKLRSHAARMKALRAVPVHA